MTRSPAFASCGGKYYIFSFHRHFFMQRTFFPFLQVAYHAEPCRVRCLLKIESIVVRLYRFQAEYFDECSCFFTEVQTCLDDFRVVEYHQLSWFQVFWKWGKYSFAYFTVTVYQKFWLVAHWQRKLGDAFVGQRVVIVAYMDMFGFFHYFVVLWFICRKSTSFFVKSSLFFILPVGKTSE